MPADGSVPLDLESGTRAPERFDHEVGLHLCLLKRPQRHQAAIRASRAHLRFLLLILAEWLQRQKVSAIVYLLEENRVLREQLGDRRIRFTDAQRRRLR